MDMGILQWIAAFGPSMDGFRCVSFAQLVVFASATIRVVRATGYMSFGLNGYDRNNNYMRVVKRWLY